MRRCEYEPVPVGKASECRVKVEQSNTEAKNKGACCEEKANWNVFVGVCVFACVDSVCCAARLVELAQNSDGFSETKTLDPSSLRFFHVRSFVAAAAACLNCAPSAPIPFSNIPRRPGQRSVAEKEILHNHVAALASNFFLSFFPPFLRHLSAPGNINLSFPCV